MSKILVVGTGAWGTTLANVLLENGHQVNIFGIDDRQISDLKLGYNREFFRAAKLHDIPHLVTNDFSKGIAGVDYMLLSIPSKYIENFLQQYKQQIKENIIIINSSKGLDTTTGNNYFKLINGIVTKNEVCAIVGPSYAIEVFHHQHTIVNIVCKNAIIGNKACKLFNNNYFKTKLIKDEIGASIASALKNGLAVGCGVMYGLNLSINTISAVITRGVQEINTYIMNNKGLKDTIIEYCSIGDIYLTCSDSKSRNFRLGELIAKVGAKTAIEENTFTVEGIEVIKDIYPKIKNKNEYILFNQLYLLINNKIKAKDFITKLWKII